MENLATDLDLLLRRYRRPHLWLWELKVIHQYRVELAKPRNAPAYAALFDRDRTPLVTVRIALWRRMKWSGMRTGFVPKLVAIHHLERSQWGA